MNKNLYFDDEIKHKIKSNKLLTLFREIKLYDLSYKIPNNLSICDVAYDEKSRSVAYIIGQKAKAKLMDSREVDGYISKKFIFSSSVGTIIVDWGFSKDESAFSRLIDINEGGINVKIIKAGNGIKSQYVDYFSIPKYFEVKPIII